jgi:hypothetical protein
MMRFGNTDRVTRASVVYDPLHIFLCTVSLYHVALRVSLISNKGLQYAVESLICIHLVKEHRAR